MLKESWKVVTLETEENTNLEQHRQSLPDILSLEKLTTNHLKIFPH